VEVMPRGTQEYNVAFHVLKQKERSDLVRPEKATVALRTGSKK